MPAILSKFTYKGISLLPLLLVVPLLILNLSPHWSYDESTTYVLMQDCTPAQIVAYEKYNLANNHVLNTLYYYWLEGLGVKSIFWFRLPSLLLFFGYFWLVSRLLKQQEDYQLRHIDQLMLYLWPFSIYFAQARGYAIAMVCFLWALLFFKQYLQQGKPRQLLGFVILGSLSSIAIFSFLFPFVAMLAILGIRRFKEVITSPLRIAIMALAIPALLYIFDKGQVISKSDPAIIGRDSLFRGGTLSSMISFLTLNEFAPRNLFLFFKVIYTLTLLPVLYFFIKNARWYIELTIVVVTLLILVFCHYAFGAMYPIYRGVAYLIMLLLLCLAYAGFRKSIFSSIHFSVIILIGCVYLGTILYYNSQKGIEEVLAHVAEDPGTVIVEELHMAPEATNLMKYEGKLDIVNNCVVDDFPCFDNALDTAKYVICRPGRIEKGDHGGDFVPVFDIASFFYFDKTFYKRKE